MKTDNKIDIATFITRLAEANEGLEESSLSPSTRLNDLEDWDSLAVLVTVVMIETEYEVEVQGADIEQCETVQQIAALVASKTGTAG